MQPGEIYFWTATIRHWSSLLLDDNYKTIVMDSLAYLSSRSFMDIFAFVVMPNHIHLIWRKNKTNGKESGAGSFLKYTAHNFKKMLRQKEPDKLSLYRVDASNKRYEFWQRDPLALHLSKPDMSMRVLNYIHNNPLASHWQLVNDPCAYKYSSAAYYEKGGNDFGFLKHIQHDD